MKGVILAAFGGEKLLPLTLAVPKHLLPVYDKPMVYYPFELLVRAGIKDVLVITNKKHQPLFKEALKNGEGLGVNLSYLTQEAPDGIAYAISLAEDYIGDDNVCVITGDTILVGESINTYVLRAINALKRSGSATVFVKRDLNKDQFGRVVLNNKGQCQSIEGFSEAYNYGSIVGLYVFPADVAKRAKLLSSSCRGRKEITDLFSMYYEENRLQVLNLDNDVSWFDTNSPDSILRCSNYLFNNKKNNYDC